MRFSAMNHSSALCVAAEGMSPTPILRRLQLIDDARDNLGDFTCGIHPDIACLNSAGSPSSDVQSHAAIGRDLNLVLGQLSRYCRSERYDNAV